MLKLIILSLFLTLVSSKVVELNEDNWSDLLNGDWMVELWVKYKKNVGGFVKNNPNLIFSVNNWFFFSIGHMNINF